MHIKVLRQIDIVLVWIFVRLFSRTKYFYASDKALLYTTPKKILIIRIRGLGSAVLTFPMIKQLQLNYGNDIQYDLLGSKRTIPLYKRQGYFTHYYDLFNLKDFLRLILKFKDYDIVIDTEEYFRTSTLLSMRLGKLSVGFAAIRNRRIGYNMPVPYNDQQHVVLTFLDLLRPLQIIPATPLTLEPVKIETQDIEKGDDFLEPYSAQIKVCLHTGGAETSTERFWSTTHRIELIELLHTTYKERIVFFFSGTKSDLEVIQAIQSGINTAINTQILATPLFVFCYILSRCDLLISNDTGPMHLGAAMGIKTIGLFGPNLPQRFGPYPADKNIALYEGDGTAYINVHLGEFLPCSQSIVDQITPQMVYEEAVKAIS